MFGVKNNISDDVKEKINDIVNELCNRSGEYLIDLKNENNNKTFFAEHLTEIAKSITSIKQEDLKNKETLNEFLFVCIGLFDTDESRQIIYDKLTDAGIFYVFKNMSDDKKLKYMSHLPERFRNNDSFFGSLGVNPNSELAKRFNSVEGFINKRKNNDNPWKLAESEKNFFVDHKNEIRDKITGLSEEDFKENKDEANKFKLLCCTIFPEADDRKAIFNKIGDGSDADIISTLKKLSLSPEEAIKMFFYLPDTLQITEAFKYAVCKDEQAVNDFEKEMSDKLNIKQWKEQAWALFFVVSHILLLPTGISELILWFSSDYRKSLKTRIENDAMSLPIGIDKTAQVEHKIESTCERQKEIKRKLIYQFIISAIKSILSIIGFILLVYDIATLPFSVFVSCCWISLVSHPILMALILIPNLGLIKSLCIGIKNAVVQNRQAQQTLSERKNKWQKTLKSIEKKQPQKSVGQETSSFDDQLTQSENNSAQNLIPNNINSINDESGRE